MAIKKIATWWLVCSVTTLNAIAHGTETGDPKRGEAITPLCLACHGAKGEGHDNPGAEAWPRLAGQNAGYLVKQLQDIKANKRSAITMLGFVNMLDDQKMADVSAYYASLPLPNLVTQPVAPEVLALGEKLVNRGDWQRYIPACNSCHGPASLGVDAKFPGIANQQPNYLAKQLYNWQQDKRNNDPDALMKTIAQRLTPNDIEAVSAYLSQGAGQTTAPATGGKP